MVDGRPVSPGDIRVPTVVMQQIDIGRELLEGSVGDLTLLTQARTPDALLHAEMEVLRRASGRMIGAAQTFNIELSRTWSEASAASHTEIN